MAFNYSSIDGVRMNGFVAGTSVAMSAATTDWLLDDSVH